MASNAPRQRTLAAELAIWAPITALALAVPTVVGLTVDHLLHTTPWALLACALMAMAGMTFGVVRATTRRYRGLAPAKESNECQAT